jgi:hypothetical protein
VLHAVPSSCRPCCLLHCSRLNSCTACTFKRRQLVQHMQI